MSLFPEKNDWKIKWSPNNDNVRIDLIECLSLMSFGVIVLIISIILFISYLMRILCDDSQYNMSLSIKTKCLSLFTILFAIFLIIFDCLIIINSYYQFINGSYLVILIMSLHEFGTLGYYAFTLNRLIIIQSKPYYCSYLVLYIIIFIQFIGRGIGAINTEFTFTGYIVFAITDVFITFTILYVFTTVISSSIIQSKSERIFNEIKDEFSQQVSLFYNIL